MKTMDTIVRFETGLHARPATKFVQLAKSFASDIRVIHGEKSADAKSILDVMTLGVYKDTPITITAEGGDELEAVTALCEYVQKSE